MAEPSAGNSDTLSITGGGVVKQIGPAVTYTNAMLIGTAGASGTLAPADGMVLVSGVGSLLDVGANNIDVAANGGTGALIVQQGGTVDAGSANSSLSASVLIANSAGNGSIRVTDAGSTLNATGYFLDGRGGTGSLTIENGGLVVVRDAPLNGSGIGIGAGRSAGPSSAANVGGTGVATVSGGCVLDLASNVSGITVGGDGVNGVLDVNSGGTVLAGTGVTVGTATELNGTIYGGTGSLNIGAGGTVLVTEALQSTNYGVIVGNANSSVGGATDLATGVVTVSGSGAILNTNTNGIAVGLLSEGDLVITGGATVVAGVLNSALI
jgi:T5SS/PEP-CTERM-associated repeat protein